MQCCLSAYPGQVVADSGNTTRSGGGEASSSQCRQVARLASDVGAHMKLGCGDADSPATPVVFVFMLPLNVWSAGQA